MGFNILLFPSFPASQTQRILFVNLLQRNGNGKWKGSRDYAFFQWTFRDLLNWNWERIFKRVGAIFFEIRWIIYGYAFGFVWRGETIHLKERSWVYSGLQDTFYPSSLSPSLPVQIFFDSLCILARTIFPFRLHVCCRLLPWYEL